MNYLVVGAGNASRPVARLLNHLGHHVVITDLKKSLNLRQTFKEFYFRWKMKELNWI